MLKHIKERRYTIIAAVAALFFVMIGVWIGGGIGSDFVGLGGLIGIFLLVSTVLKFIVDFLN